MWWSTILAIICSLAVVSSLDNGLGRTPIMGWTTWCTETGLLPCFDDFCNEAEVKSMADAFVSSGLRDLGYTYLNLDDCWAGPRDTNGEMTADSTRFPSGTLKPLADYLHARGLKLGLYTDVGNKTCRGGRPGSWGHYDQDAKTWAKWGIDYVKMDWCDRPLGEPEYLYGLMRDALNNSGRAMFYNTCEWGRDAPWEWGMKTANAWRVGPDHLPLWWTPETSQDPGQGQGTANIIEHMAGLSKYAGPGGWNDPDFLMIGYFWMWEGDRQTEFGMWALWAAPLIVATDLRDLSNKQEILNPEVIAVNQDPLGIPGDRYANNSDGGQVWSRPLHDGSWAVVLYNSNIVVEWCSIQLNFSPEHLPGWPVGKTSAKVRDLWARQDLGIFQNSFTSDYLAAHASQMLKVTPQ